MGYNFDMGGGVRYDSEEYRDCILKKDGGKGSGNWGHAGRPGIKGGSAAGTGGASSSGSGSAVKAKTRPASGTEAQKDSDLSKHGVSSAGAQKAYDDARAKEPQITDDMCEIADALGNEMYGLEYSVKTASSVKDKIERKMETAAQKKLSVSEEDIVNGMGDLVRYTQMTEHNRIAESVQETIDILGRKGYDVTEVENKYLDPTSDYKGVHINAISPTGQKFELQIHSQESMEVKNTIHPMYEEARNVATPAKRKAELKDAMKAISATLPMPKGIDSIKDFKK